MNKSTTSQEKAEKALRKVKALQQPYRSFFEQQTNCKFSTLQKAVVTKPDYVIRVVRAAMRSVRAEMLRDLSQYVSEDTIRYIVTMKCYSSFERLKRYTLAKLKRDTEYREGNKLIVVNYLKMLDSTRG